MQKTISKELADQILANSEILSKFTQSQLTNMKWDSYFLRLKKQLLEQLIKIFDAEIRRKRGKPFSLKGVEVMQFQSKQNWRYKQQMQECQKQMEYQQRRQQKQQQEKRAPPERPTKEWEEYQRARLAPRWYTRVKNKLVSIFCRPSAQQPEKVEQLEQQPLLNIPYQNDVQQKQYLNSRKNYVIEKTTGQNHLKME